MVPNDCQNNEDFESEIDSAVDSFFSHYEENAPKMSVSSQETEVDITSEEESALEMGDSSHAPESDTASEEEEAPETEDPSLDSVFAMLSRAENAPQTDISPDESEPDTPAEAGEAAPEKHQSGSGRSAKKGFDPTATHVFNSLTEAILSVDWEVNDANVNGAIEILEEIKAQFPVLKESRSQDVINGMLKTLDAISKSPQRMPTSAMAQLEKAIPILRGIASGAQMEDGYDALIEDAIAGLEACIPRDEAAEDSNADSPSLMTDEEISLDNGEDELSEDKGPEPIAVPAGVSRALCHHSKVAAQLTRRAKRLSGLYAAAQGSENVQVLLNKICSLLELQTRALQDVFSLNCDIAVFPIGKINNVSDFLDFQRMAMGACLRHARKLEKAFKKQWRRNRFWQSFYFLRIAMEKQVDELARITEGEDSPSQETESTVPAPL